MIFIIKILIMNESQLKDTILKIYREEQHKILQEKWNRLSKKDKVFVFEFAKVIYPEKAKLIKEDKWYNTVGDIAGIFDPTGLVDLVNGISYWRQGDKLFALLSWVSAVPFLGDAIAKPVIGVMKVGGESVKAFKAASVAGDAVKIAETAKAAGGPIAKMVEKAPTWGDRLMAMLNVSVGKVPFLGKGLVKTIGEYVNIFSKASKEMKVAGQEVKVGSELIKGEKAISAAEKEQLAKEVSKPFSGYGGYKNKWLKYMGSEASLMDKFRAGVPRVFGGNPATRALMRRTKWYLGLLDWLGIGNFIGPDELIKQVPDLAQKEMEYNQTTEAQNLWNQEMSGVSTGVTQPSVDSGDGQSVTQNIKQDAFSSLISSLLGGSPKLV